MVGVIDRITNYVHVHKRREGKSVTQNMTTHWDPKVTFCSVTKIPLKTPHTKQVVVKQPMPLRMLLKARHDNDQAPNLTRRKYGFRPTFPIFLPALEAP